MAIMASVASTFAAPFLGFLLSTALADVGDGPAVGLGLLALVVIWLVAAYLGGVIGTMSLAYALWKSNVRSTPMDRYWLGLGSAYCVAGGLILVAAA